MLRVLVLIMAMTAPGAVAQTLVPQLHDVTGVRADDVLNIRAEPNARAPILGSLAPDARGIEVVALNDAGTWGLINHGESTGWVSLRYMAPRGVHIDHYNLPVGMRCFGTEPFWSLDHDRGTLRYEAMGEAALLYDVEISQDTGIAEDFTRMIRASGLIAFVYPAACSDGMSDRAYGLSVGIMTGPATALLTGCCTLAR
jgi:uncharacterized membrane protein